MVAMGTTVEKLEDFDTGGSGFSFDSCGSFSAPARLYRPFAHLLASTIDTQTTAKAKNKINIRFVAEAVLKNPHAPIVRQRTRADKMKQPIETSNSPLLLGSIAIATPPPMSIPTTPKMTP